MDLREILFAQFPAFFLLSLLFLAAHLRVRKHSAVKSVLWVLLFGAALCCAAAALGCALTPWVLRALAVPDSIFGITGIYLRITFLGAPFTFFYNALAAGLKSVGDSKTPLKFLAFSAVLNAVLDLILIGGLGFGIVCSAVTTVVAEAASALLAAACMVRCMCGFEFITTFLILCEIPLCYAAAKAYFVRRDPHGALVWLGRTVGAGVSALGGVTAALALWFAQEWLCFGSAADAWQNMTRAVTDRVSLTDGAVRDVNVPQVLAQYFRESTEPLLQLGPVSVTAWQLLLFALLVGAVSVVVCLRRGTAAQLVPPCIVWGLGLAAPASWMVLSKAHAAIHTHLVPMLWHFAFVPISCMLLPVLAKLMIPGRKKDLVASH